MTFKVKHDALQQPVTETDDWYLNEFTRCIEPVLAELTDATSDFIVEHDVAMSKLRDGTKALRAELVELRGSGVERVRGTRGLRRVA